MDIEQIRSDFPALSQTVYGKPLIYLDNAASTQIPRQAVEAMADYMLHSHSNVHRSVHRLGNEATRLYEGARAGAASFLNADEDEVVFTGGTTEAIDLIARAAGDTLEAGDIIAATELEHHSNYLPWARLCERRGAVFQTIPLDGQGRLDLERAQALLRGGRVRLLTVCHVSNVTGVRNPLETLIGMAKEQGTPVLVDGAQGIRHEAVDVKALDCDFYCFSAHKLFGPTGVGVLYAKRRWLEAWAPVRLGGGMVNRFEGDIPVFERPPLRFEAGTPNIAGAVGLQAALAYLTELGLPWIRRRERQLNRRLAQALERVPGVKLLGPPENRTGMVSFVCEGASAFDVAVMLDKLGVAVRSGSHCAIPQMRRLGVLSAVRASPAFYNTEDELEAFARCLRDVLGVLRR